MNNYEKIKNMSIEEMVTTLILFVLECENCSHQKSECVYCVKLWLQSESEE